MFEYASMAKRCRISLKLRVKIVILSEEGYTQRQIATRMEQGVCKVLKKNKCLGSVVDKNIPDLPNQINSKQLLR